MLELIVLGRVPGTDLQISFEMILTALLLLLAGLLVYIDITLYRSRRLKRFSARVHTVKRSLRRKMVMQKIVRIIRLKSPA